VRRITADRHRLSATSQHTKDEILPHQKEHQVRESRCSIEKKMRFKMRGRRISVQRNSRR
jgi:O-phosphoseryl-tRNA(Cys) synthetase